MVVVTFTDTDQLTTYVRDNEVPFTMVVDPDRSAYRAYGLGRGSLWNVWGPKTLRRYAQIYRRRGWTRRHSATEDTMQLGGDFVIAADGRIAYAYRGEGPWDRPPVDQLVAASLRHTET